MSTEQSEATRLPERGEVFLMPLADGRIGACRVLRGVLDGEEAREVWQRGCVLVAATPWVGDEPPALNEPLLREVLRIRVSHHSNAQHPYLGWVREPVPVSFTRLGVVEPTDSDERLLLIRPHSIDNGYWKYFPGQALSQWRRDREHEALTREEEERGPQSREAARERQGWPAALNLPQLRKKRRFLTWREFVEDKPLRATRRAFRDTVQALIDLGPAPRTRDALRILRACIRRLNELDEEHDHFIMSSERDELFDEFDEIVHAVGLGDYPSMADRWRDW